ncbi:OsmC family protein [Tessaracoccus sp. MC1627]|uniref:OsmC family protein n=1 Tax=Tessaracoccus sp. MC1627 TaxID=2760312 RepID=UPI0016023EB5|nr:OsmC family protein [Tessaracoccus sp. MC1627]MBB1512057.1 OsmC family protein [Tessaracoccus sp. MC1627]
MIEETRRPTAVQVTRLSHLSFEARNERGGSVPIGSGDSSEFTPVELLMAAIAACGAIDVDLITHRRSEPDVFNVDVTASRVKDSTGNRLEDIEVTFSITFPEGEDGDRARLLLGRGIEQAHDRLCTVSRTIELGTPVTMKGSDV